MAWGTGNDLCVLLCATGDRWRKHVVLGARLGGDSSGVSKLLQNVLPHYACFLFAVDGELYFFLVIFCVDRDQSPDLRDSDGGHAAALIGRQPG